MSTNKPISTIIQTAACTLLLLFMPVTSVFAWSSVDTIKAFSTHQFLNKQAYDALKVHPAFKLIYFPSLEEIQRYSGMTLLETGLGPDAKGNSKYSDHWFNPKTDKGEAPITIGALHSDLRKELGKYIEVHDISYAYKNKLARMAAYAAHYMQDLTCPMHVSGMEAGDLNKRVIGSIKDNSPYSPTYTRHEWEILIDRFNDYSHGRPDINFFDPLYFDGFLSSYLAEATNIGSIKTGTHFQYELQVETKYHSQRGAAENIWKHYRADGYIPKNYNNQTSMEKLARYTAVLTRKRIGSSVNPGPLWYTKNNTIPIPDFTTITQQLVNTNVNVPYEDWWRAVQLSYVLWRSAFTSLYIKKENIRLEGIPDQQDLFQLSIKISNFEPLKGKVKNISVLYETEGGIFARGSLRYDKGLAESDQTGWLKFKQPILIEDTNNLSGKILFTVTGSYPNTIPDSGTRQIGYNLPEIKIIIPEKKEEKKDADKKTANNNQEKNAQVRDEQKPADDKKVTAPNKDEYVIKAIAIETIEILKNNKSYRKVDNIDAAVVIIRMRGNDSIVDGYNALSILIEKGYVYPVQGVGYVTSEKFVDFMVEDIDPSLLNQSKQADDRPALVKKTKPDSSKDKGIRDDVTPPTTDSDSPAPPSLSGNWRSLNDQEFVQNLYKSILDRSPDTSGYNHWLKLLSSGKSRESCLSWFFKSPEYTSRNKTDADFILDVYQSTYGRNPTQTELEDALENLRKGISRQQMVDNKILSSQSTLLSKNTEKKNQIATNISSKPCGKVIGKWSWFNGNTVTFSENGTMGGDPKFTWSCDGTNPDRVTINWNNKWIDKLTLSKGGGRLKGKNQHGTIVWGNKM
jgi:hypothetical protein